MNLTLQRYHICIAVVKHFSVYFHGAKANILSVFACAAVRLRVSSHTAFSVINVISFQLFLNAVACLENIGDKFLLLYYNINNIIIKFSLCIKVWRVFKLKTDDIDDGGKLIFCAVSGYRFEAYLRIAKDTASRLME